MIESLAMGIPTIVTDCPCGGARMLIKDNYSGFLIPVKNVDMLVKKMQFVIDYPEETKKNMWKRDKSKGIVRWKGNS